MDKSTSDQGLCAFLNDRDRLIGLACKIVENHAVAEELVQDSWIRWQQHSYPSEKAMPILRQIVANLARDWHRRQAREWNILNRDDLQMAEGPDSERLVIAREELAIVVAALREMPKRHVKAFRLSSIDGRTYAEIAQLLGVSRSRAFQLVRETLIHLTLRLDEIAP